MESLIDHSLYPAESKTTREGLASFVSFFQACNETYGAVCERVSHVAEVAASAPTKEAHAAVKAFRKADREACSTAASFLSGSEGVAHVEVAAAAARSSQCRVEAVLALNEVDSFMRLDLMEAMTTVGFAQVNLVRGTLDAKAEQAGVLVKAAASAIREDRDEAAQRQARLLTESAAVSTPPHEPGEREGPLFLRSERRMLKDWKRRWCTLRHGTIAFQADDGSEPLGRLDLLLCSVKLLTSDEAPGSRANVIELTSRTEPSLYMQAETATEAQEWIADLRESTARRLNAQLPETTFFTDVTKSNPTCADCGAPKPVWTSLNNCVVVC
jgi:hypothetical protein